MSANDHLETLFGAYAAGDPEALGPLVAALYDELRRLARGQLRRGQFGERPAILQTTMLVHEAYLKLGASSSSPARDRQHFFAVCARAMRQLIVDRARQENAVKRGGDHDRLALTAALELIAPVADQSVERVHQALEQLETINPRLVRLVELRVFAGASEAEAAELLGQALRTVQRDWHKAKAWLRVALESS
jgi:RNA polymerase sigma-70 factor, ECF subfamily